MFKNSIFRRILCTYMALLIALLSVIAVLLSLGYNRYVFQQKQEELRSAAEETSLLLKKYRRDEITYSELSNSLDLLSSLTDSRIYAIKVSKESLQNEKLLLDNELLDNYLIEDLQAILDGREVYRKRQYTDRFGSQVVFVGIPLENTQNIEGAILLFAPVEEIMANIARINMIIWLSAGAAAIISGLIIYLISLKISRPLKKIEEGAKKLASGEEVEDFNFNTGDELESLAQAFNYMKNKINSTEEMRREFIASVSHDLKTPLTSINGFIQGMLDGLVQPEQFPKYLSIIKKESQRLQGLTDDILEAAKYQSGSIILARQYFPVKEFLEQIIEAFAMTCQEKQLTLEIRCPEDLEVYADQERLKQVLINIVSNACKFTQESGRILISACRLEDRVCFSIRDNGQGIPAEELPFIFEKFYRGDKSRREATGGTGLGLNIVKRLVELHGGRVEAWSEVGKGTEIKLSIPG